MTNAAFTTKDGAVWTPSDDLLARLSAAHPQADIDAELAKAAAWCEVNPSRRKTANGMPRFLLGWFGRSRPRPQPSGNGSEELTIDDIREIMAASKDEK